MMIEVGCSMMRVQHSWKAFVSSCALLAMWVRSVMMSSIAPGRQACTSESSRVHRVNPGHSGGRSPESSPLWRWGCGVVVVTTTTSVEQCVMIAENASVQRD